ncbi:MAG: hypothetical protein U0271_20745 [Polyangiaceae bacterium]
MSSGARRLAVVAIVTSATACGGSTDSADHAQSSSSTSGSASASASARVNAALTLSGAVSFAAYGGQGVLPDTAKPSDFVRVVTVVDLTVAAAQGPVSGLRIDAIELLDDAGNVLAKKRELIDAKVLGHGDAPFAGRPSWSEALDGKGPAFDGTCGVGSTRLRVEAWLDTHPARAPVRARVTLVGAGALVIAEGKVDGEWPTG